MQIGAIAIVQRSSSPKLQFLSLSTQFALFGMIMGSWASRIPALRESMPISHAALSLVLLCGGLGAVLSFPLSSRLMAGFGARKTVLYAGLALAGILVLIGLTPSVPLLMLAVLMLGIAAGCLDVGINSLATKLEKRTGKSELSRLHALGCAGSLAGAALGSLMAGMRIEPAQHFAMVAIPASFAFWLSCESLEADDSGEKIGKKTFSLPRGPLALLGVLGFFAAMSEGSIADWSGVFLKERFDVADGFAPLGLTAFSVMMLLARLAGDRLKAKHGAQRLVSCGAVLSASGLFFAVLAPDAYLALLGFAMAGLGLAVVFPFVFSAAGSQGPAALAGVATMAYSGSLMGPPVVGSLAHSLGMQVAMGFIGVLSAAIALVAGRAALLK
jgi:fucose permease